MARQLRRVTATFSNPSSAGAYTAGDEISSSITAASVVLPTFDLTGFRKVSIKKLGIDITPASGNLVITNLGFAVLICKTADAPTPVGDNVAAGAALTGVQRGKSVKFNTFTTLWSNQLDATTAGTSGFQSALPNVPTVNGGLFEFTGSEANGEVRRLTAYTQVRNAWTPGAVINTFNYWLDLEVEP